jgi:hypothetical protein
VTEWEVMDMVGMLDYQLHYGLMAAEDRVRDALRERRSTQPIRPHRHARLLRTRNVRAR